jgi:hypothetical protein
MNDDYEIVQYKPAAWLLGIAFSLELWALIILVIAGWRL